MMNIVNFQGSFAKKNILARNIVNVSNDIFSSLEEKKQFVTMVAIESKFNSEAVSGAGAVGLTQVIPKYAKEFAEKCGMDDVRQEDLKNPEINLLVGACRFKALLDAFNGNTAAALVAYNAGAGSDQLKQLKSLRNITNVESSSYVAKWLYLKNKADSESKE
jgi:soluble lytic murein transglycosylase-like protein